MLNQIKKLIPAVFFLGLLSGCDPNIPLNNSFWKDHKQKVMVALVQPAKPGFATSGDQGLFDIIVNNITNHTIANYLASINVDWYRGYQADFVHRLSERHIKALAYRPYLSSSITNYSVYSKTISGNKLLVINLISLGVTRNFIAIIPTNLPQVFCVLSGQLIDLKTKAILWRYTSQSILDIPRPWHQPPNYPNVTIALKKAVRLSTQDLLNNFFEAQNTTKK